jgi:hypothetical protein
MHALLILAAFATEPAPASPTQVGRIAPLQAVRSAAINAVVGDASVELGYVPADAGEDARIAGHLRLAHDLLAAVDTSSWPAEQRAARAKNLARLAAYADAGRFPRNDAYPGTRRPTFVDHRGAICAVGALFAADCGRAAADRVARAYRYAYIPEIHDAELAAWQRESGLSMRELATIQPAYSYWPRMDDEAWAPPSLLDRMLPGSDRLGVVTEIFGGGVGLTVHGQTRWPDVKPQYVYAALPLAIAEPISTTAAAGGSVPTSHDLLLENSELGMYVSRSHLLMKLGAVLPTGSETPPRTIGARVEDAVLELPRAAGGRVAVSYVRALTVEHCGACSYQAQTRLRVDAGYDLVDTLADDTWHAIPHGGVGLSWGSQQGFVLIETGVSRAPEPLGDPHLRWSTGITGRARTVHGRGKLVDIALTAAAVHDVTGWAATLSLELAYVRNHGDAHYRDGDM